MRILIVEDDIQTADFICKGLRQNNHSVDHAANGEDGLHLALTEEYEVLVLDRMLPILDGLTIVKTLRKKSLTTPVLILSALGDVDHRVEGLQAGGDD